MCYQSWTSSLKKCCQETKTLSRKLSGSLMNRLHSDRWTPTPTEFADCWRCAHSMRGRVYLTVRCPSVCLWVPSITAAAAAATAGLLLNVLQAGDIDWWLRAPTPRTSCQGCRRDGISIPIPIPYRQKILWVSPQDLHTHRNQKSYIPIPAPCLFITRGLFLFR